MKQMVSILVVAVVLLGMATPVFAAPPNPGSGSTNFTVQNLDAAGDAAVQADYVNQSGEVDASPNKTIGPLASDGFPASASGLDDGWLGSVVVSADKEIVAFAQMIWQSGDSADGKTAGAYNGFTAGADKLYLPSLANRDSQFSRISVQSAEAPSTVDSVAFTITFYDRDGNISGTINDTVLKGAQQTYDLSLSGVTGSGIPDLDPVNATNDWLGSAVIEAADAGTPLAAVATMHWRDYAAGYSAVSGGGTIANMPSATRRYISAQWVQYTGVVVQNLDAATAAELTVTWYDRLGNELISFDDTIPANSAHGYNTRFTSGSQIPVDPAVFEAAIGDDWNGSVVIEATNGVDIVAVANLQWTAAFGGTLAASAYTSEPAGYETVYVPANFRLTDASGWLQYTGLIVQNVGTTACTDFDVTWIMRGESTPALTFQDSLDPNISHGYNTRVGADMGTLAPTYAAALTDNFRGAVTISAPGCELIAIHNTVWPYWTDNTTYSGFGR